MRSLPTSPQKQQGAILVVSLLLLLVMTVLALTASQTTRLQERMAGNARDFDLAFQAGEAGLRAAELRIEEETADGEAMDDCEAMEDGCAPGRESAPEHYLAQTTEWWGDNAMAYEDDLDEVSNPPLFYTEEWADVSDTLTRGASVRPSGTRYYVNTSRAQGGSESTVVMLESTYAKSY